MLNLEGNGHSLFQRTILAESRPAEFELRSYLQVCLKTTTQTFHAQKSIRNMS
jgi:hypothetical protein